MPYRLCCGICSFQALHHKLGAMEVTDYACSIKAKQSVFRKAICAWQMLQGALLQNCAPYGHFGTHLATAGSQCRNAAMTLEIVRWQNDYKIAVVAMAEWTPPCDAWEYAYMTATTYAYPEFNDIACCGQSLRSCCHSHHAGLGFCACRNFAQVLFNLQVMHQRYSQQVHSEGFQAASARNSFDHRACASLS